MDFSLWYGQPFQQCEDMVMPDQRLVDYREISAILTEITNEVAGWQNPIDGGWSIPQPQPESIYRSNTWTTAQLAHWLMHFDADRYQDRVMRALQFLAEMQHLDENGFAREEADGGWGWYSDKDSESSGTALAMLAFVEYVHRFNTSEPFTENMRRGVNWLIRHVNRDGGYSLHPNLPSVAFNTCWSCIVLNECSLIAGLEDPQIHAAILPRAMYYLESTRKPNGWGYYIEQGADTIGTAYCTHLLLHMGRVEAASFGLRALRNSQLPTGGWEVGAGLSNIEATTWAVVSLLKGGMDPFSPCIQSAVRYFRKYYVPRLGWPERTGQIQIWTTYFAYMALSAYVESIRMIELPTDHKRRQ